MQKRLSKHRIVLLIAAAILVIVAGFFAYEIFFGNPLQGKWTTSKGEYFITIEKEDGATDVDAVVLVKEELVKVELKCELDKKAKTITFSSEPDDYEEDVKELKGAVTAVELHEHLQDILKAFDYSLDKDTLTLIDREYGEKLIFTRVE
jgi:hypothetical protein